MAKQIQAQVIEVLSVVTWIAASSISPKDRLRKTLGMSAGLIELLYKPFTGISEEHKGGRVLRRECAKLKDKTVKDAVDLVTSKVPA